MRLLIICLTILIFKTESSAYSSFQKLFGDGFGDHLLDVVRTSDGGYCAGGTTDLGANDSTDLVIYRTNATGDLLYSFRIGDAQQNLLTGLIQNADESFTLCGYTFGTFNDPNNSEIFLTRVDDFGNLIWSNSYGTIGPDQANGLLKRWDGSVIVTGTTAAAGSAQQSALIFKVDGLGQLLWSTTLNANFSSSFTKAINTADGGVLAVGSTHDGSANADHLVAKFDNNGTLLWSKRIFNTAQPTAELSEDVIPAGDGGFIICGYAEKTLGSDYDHCLYKIDGNGNLVWSQLIGSPQNDLGFSLIKAYNGNYIVAGQTNANLSELSCMFETDSTGFCQWAFEYGSPGNISRLKSIIYGSDGGYAACGRDESPGLFSEGYFLKTLDSGSTGCNETSLSLSATQPAFSALSTQQSGQTVFLNEGFTAFTVTNYINQFGQYCSFIGIDEQQSAVTLFLYPNPATTSLQLTNKSYSSQYITVMDVLGNVVLYTTITGNTTESLSVATLAKGLYQLRFTDGNRQGAVRWIKE